MIEPTGRARFRRHGEGGGEVTPVPQATSWLLCEASVVFESEEEDMPDAQGDSPQGPSVITISEDEEGGGRVSVHQSPGTSPR